MKQILVLGSLNIDLVQHVPRLPHRGETLKGGELQMFAGGKGANQACAAALLGGRVSIAGMVGNDVFASRLMTDVQRAGVDTGSVRATDISTGSATILVLPNGDNIIVISAGANGNVSEDFALQAVQNLRAGDFLLCQLEIPIDAVKVALKSAHERQVITILDPAPACHLPDDLLRSVAILTPNQTEAALLTGAPANPESLNEAEIAARKLQARGAQTVIVKMGRLGCLVAQQGAVTVSAGFDVTSVDATAAGDTFNGALAVALAEEVALLDAAQFANAAAAISVTRPGAISSIPTRSEVEEFLASSARRR